MFQLSVHSVQIKCCQCSNYVLSLFMFLLFTFKLSVLDVVSVQIKCSQCSVF